MFDEKIHPIKSEEPDVERLPSTVRKTKELKYSKVYPEPPQGFWDRKTVAFQPIGSSIPIMNLEENTEAKLASLLGLEKDPHPASRETRRRIHVVAERAFSPEWFPEKPPIPFSGEALAKITAYIDAFPKQLGYAHSAILQREAGLLIPRPIEYALDVDELLQSFFIWRNNRPFLHNQLLIVGLFLLFFWKVLTLNQGHPFRYDLVVSLIISGRTENEIRQEVNRIIHEEI
jgi:hypothetical protein